MGNLSSENSNYLPMLKLVIIATTSIACILSLSGIVIAGDRYKEVNSKTKFNLVKNKTGQTPSTGTNQVAKFKDLEKLIIDVYKYKNSESNAPVAPQLDWGERYFYEVKSLTVEELADDRIQIRSLGLKHSYSFMRVYVKGQTKFIYKKNEDSDKPEKHIAIFNFDKGKNGWRIDSSRSNF